MKNLYMISLGGKAKGCNIEVHDVQFVVANHIDETVAVLKNNWYGKPEKLHMDSFKQIVGTDGFAIQLTKERPESNKKLYFVHMGGYKTSSTQELHDIGLFVGETEQEVKVRASKEIFAADIENHVDSIVAIEACMLSADGENYYVKLSESSETFDQAPDWFGYRRIDIENV